MGRRHLALHPLLFAVFPVLSLYADGNRFVTLDAVVVPLAVTVAGTLLAWGILTRVLRDAGRAALVVSISVLCLFSYGHVYNMVESWRVEIGGRTLGANQLLLPAWGALWLAGVYLSARTRRDTEKVSGFLTVCALTLVVVPLLAIVPYESGRLRRGPLAPMPTPRARAQPAPKRDVYYIILDRYAGAATLERLYDFDNREFLDFLRGRGFYVADRSRANYLKSAHSIASSLNMQHLDALAGHVGTQSDDWAPLTALLQDYPVWRFFKEQGYRFLHFGSWWDPTRENDNADVNVNLGPLSGFSRVLFESTAPYPIVRRLGLLDKRVEHWERIVHQLPRLAEVALMEEPTFTFAHFLLPHRPYVFARDGRFRSRSEEQKTSAKENYLEQLRFTNARIRELVEALLARSAVEPIIIIQADEGPFPPRYGKNVRYFDWTKATVDEVREKMEILNALHLPGIDPGVLYPTITPVNAFRVVLNAYFDTGLELLPDTSYGFVNEDRLYDFFVMDERLFGTEAAGASGD
jgi:hypothetical protein